MLAYLVQIKLKNRSTQVLETLIVHVMNHWIVRCTLDTFPAMGHSSVMVSRYGKINFKSGVLCQKCLKGQV